MNIAKLGFGVFFKKGGGMSPVFQVFKMGWSSFLCNAYFQAPSHEGDYCTISSKGIMSEAWVL